MQPGDEADQESATLTIHGDFAYGMLLAEAACIASSAFRRSTRRRAGHVVCVALRLPELPEDATSRSTRKISASTPSARVAGASTSTSPTPPSASPTSRPTSSFPARTSGRSTRTAHAMKVLKSRLFDLRMKETEASWRSSAAKARHRLRLADPQLRHAAVPRWSRTCAPEQTGDVNRVLDGDIDQFIKAYLMKKAAGTLSAASTTTCRIDAVSEKLRRAEVIPPEIPTAQAGNTPAAACRRKRGAPLRSQHQDSLGHPTRILAPPACFSI